VQSEVGIAMQVSTNPAVIWSSLRMNWSSGSTLPLISFPSRRQMKACTSAPVVPVIAKGPVPSRFMDPPDSSASPAESAFAAEVTGDEARSALPGPDDQTPA
jgi:hypothetical protein